MTKDMLIIVRYGKEKHQYILMYAPTFEKAEYYWMHHIGIAGATFWWAIPDAYKGEWAVNTETGCWEEVR